MVTVPLTRFRSDLAEVMSQVAFGEEVVLVKKFGRAVAVVAPPAALDAVLLWLAVGKEGKGVLPGAKGGRRSRSAPIADQCRMAKKD